MAYYRQLGTVPPKRHTQHRDPDGQLYYEELMGEEGFSSDSSLLYHRGVPSAIVGSEIWELPDQTRTPNHPLKPRHLKLHTLFADGATADAVTGRRLVLANSDVRIAYVVTGTDPSPYYRNAIGDECVYVESGNGTVETLFGVLSYRAGDYVLIPRATTHRWVPSGSSRLYPIEANSHIAPPKRYLSRYGQLLEHAPYCERDLRGPTEPFRVSPGSEGGTDVEVLVKHRVGTLPGGVGGSRMTYATHPFDVVGWDGCLYPYTFNIEDYMPITGKVHQPPPVHQVFEGHNFVICNFLPRKVDYHPLSIPVPYYHSNVDSDEVMFYVGGDYEARKGSGINIGSISLHPGGHAHGPQPSAIEASLGAEYFDESAVMVDTFAPLDLGEGGRAAEDPAYAWTWAGRGGDVNDGDSDGGPAVFSNS
ncbi:MAG: homogentisate 1,2-dioxygenase domain-containing protein [Nocardioides sp.]